MLCEGGNELNKLSAGLVACCAKKSAFDHQACGVPQRIGPLAALRMLTLKTVLH